MKIIAVILMSIVLIAPPNVWCKNQITMQDVYRLRDKDQLKKLISEQESIAQKKKDYPVLKLMGVAYHNLGIIKVSGSSEKSVFYLQKAYELNPDDNETLAFLGSAITMKARDSWNFFTKLSEVNKGTNLLDKAVSREPDNCVIRVVRGNNSLCLPDFLGRKKIAKQDFLKVEQILSRKNNELDSNTIAEVYYQLALIYKNEKDTKNVRSYFEKTIQTSPSSSAAHLAKNEL